MAKDLELALKIQALVKGLEEVAALTTELEDLAAAGSEPIPDNTAELRAGAGEASGALREVADATADVGDAAGESAPQMSELSVSITKAVAAGAGLAALAASLKSFADEAMEADTRGRKLEGVVRATGGAAGFTADQIREMSAELALATLGSIQGFEDAAAALLTFKTVSGETFSQALELSQDLASVMGGDAKSAALQLGKALEDPERGLTALTRAGVSFSDAEQEIIKNLVESGRLFEAQGLILEKVAGQVGGVAREMAGGLAGALDTVGQRAEELRVKLGDAMQPGLIRIANQISGALELLADNLDGVATAATAVGATAVAALAVKGVAAAQAYAASISVATVATTTLTKATLGLAAAGKVAVGGGLMLAKAWPVAVFGGVAYAAMRLSGGLEALQRDAENLESAMASLAETEERVEARLKDISAATGLTVKSLDEFNQAVFEGKIAWDDTLGTWVRVRNSMELLAAATPRAELEAVRQELELLAERGTETTAALDRIMQAADIGSVDGIRTLVSDLDYLGAAALATGEQIETALRKRLASLTAQELQAFQSQAEMAFTGSADAAAQLALVNDAVLGASFDRLGINAAAALGQISPAAADAITAVDGIVTALEAAQVGAEQSAAAIEQALTKAFDVADSLPAIDALNAKMVELAESGKIGADAMGRLADASEAAKRRIEDLTPGIQSVEEAFRKLGVTSQRELERAAREAEGAFRVIRESGTATEAELTQAFSAYAKAAVAANDGVVDATLQAEAAQLGLKVEADKSGKVIVRSMQEAAEAAKKLANESGGAKDSIADVADESERLVEVVRRQNDAVSGSTIAWLDASRAASRYAQEAGKIAVATAAAFQVSDIKDVGRSIETAQAAARDFVDTMERLDAQQQQITDTSTRGVDDLQMRLLELTGTEDEIAKARQDRARQERQDQISILQIEIERAKLRGDGAAAKEAEARIRSLRQELALLEQIFKVESQQRRLGTASSGSSGGRAGGVVESAVTTSATYNAPIHIHGITDPVKLAPIIEKELRKLTRLRT